jgi:hypothetical protein
MASLMTGDNLHLGMPISDTRYVRIGSADMSANLRTEPF